MCMWAGGCPYECKSPQRSEVSDPPAAGVTGSSKPPEECWESNPGPQEEQYVPLKPSPQPRVLFSLRHILSFPID